MSAMDIDEKVPLSPVKFRRHMEDFAREKNIPLADILQTIALVGMESQQIYFQQGHEARNRWLFGQFIAFASQFGEALPKGTKPLCQMDEDSD